MRGKMVAPASAARYMLRMWILLSGVSRRQRTRGRFSLRQTSAARSISWEAMPLAMRAKVPTLQGSTIMASAGYEPLATLAPISAFDCSLILILDDGLADRGFRFDFGEAFSGPRIWPRRLDRP